MIGDRKQYGYMISHHHFVVSTLPPYLLVSSGQRFQNTYLEIPVLLRRDQWMSCLFRCHRHVAQIDSWKPKAMSMSSDDPVSIHPQSLMPQSLWLWFGTSSQLSQLRTSAGITSHFEACGTASRLAESMGGPVRFERQPCIMQFQKFRSLQLKITHL